MEIINEEDSALQNDLVAEEVRSRITFMLNNLT